MLKRVLFIANLLLFCSVLPAQDVSVTAINSPVSGCGLTAAEKVVIKIFNFGPDLSGMPFNVSYTINGGAPVVESATFPSFLTNSTVTYTFTTTANLLTAGSYTFTASTALAGDVNTSNDTYSGYVVVNSSPSVGGTVSGATNVCYNSNSGVLTLAGQTGSILNWEYSTDGGVTWITISNTTANQSYTNLTVQTSYRARVQNSSCAVATSSIATMTINPTTVAGTTSGATTQCSGSNSGNITLSGQTGSVQNWEYSTDGGFTWNNIANTSTTQSYTNLTTTTGYRAVVKSGACASLNSTGSLITVNPVTVGGSVAPATSTVCSGTNTGTLTLSGQTGTVQRWEFSTDGGATWTNIANTATTQTYSNITTTRIFRAFVKSGVCAALYSSTATVTVAPATVAGSVATSTTVCSGANSGTLTLSGQTGSILNWEYSVNAGATWTSIANTTTTQTYSNLATSTLYRAVVQNGTCPSASSTAATITVNNPSVGGSVSGSTTVCASGNSGTMNLSGQTGAVQSWEYSTDGGSTWTSISNTTSSQNFSNLTDTTMYHVLVKSGVCPVATSSVAVITVDPVTVGGSVSSNTTACNGNNSGTLNLVGNTGSVLNWEVSNDGGLTWLSITNTTTSQGYNNITNSSFYRAQVKSGLCVSQYSGPAIITLDPTAVGGNTYGTSTVCKGSNNGSITLVGYSQSIAQWENSIDNGATWAAITNTTTTQNYTNLTQTTWYRAIVSSGVCPNDTSSITVLTVDSNSVGGILASNATVCSGSNSGTVTLSGQTGNVQNWYISTDGGISWLVVGNTTTSYAYSNLTQTTFLKADVKYGVCPSVQSAADTITVNPKADGGMLSSNASVCQTANAGVLSLTSYTGTITSWENSIDNGATWSSIANTANTYTYTNLPQTTLYHAIVSGGVCPDDTSNIVTVAVDSTTVGGTLTASDTVCSGANSGTLIISGQTGSVQSWYVSTDGGNTWLATSNTGSTYSYNNLTQTTIIKADIKNGVCPSASTSQVTITVDPLAVAGTLSSDAMVCQVSNSGNITLSGNNGTVAGWQTSIDNGVTWMPVANTTTVNAYTNLSQTTLFNAIVSSGVCPNDTSNIVTITVDSTTVGGTLNVSDTVCASGNAGVLTISGQTGSVQSWYISTDGGNTWLTTGNTGATYSYSNLTQTTEIKADVKNGVCPSASTSLVTITVDPVAVGGTLSSNATVCQLSNSGNITLSGYTGNISGWQTSIDNGVTWAPVANTTTVNAYTNLTQTTLFSAVISSGVCPNDTSSIVTIAVDSATVGGTLSASDTVCASGNSGTLTISGQTGSVQSWYISTDGGNTWLTTANTGATYSYNNLTQTTEIKADVKNGVCPSASTSLVTITVNPVAVGGTLSSNATVCQLSNNGNITLSGYTGNISGWQTSINNGVTWTPVTNTTTVNSYTNLQQTTMYQAVITSGVCPSDSSSIVTIQVDSASIGGVISKDTSFCTGPNSDTLFLNGQTGNVINWSISTDGGNNWFANTNNGTFQSFSNITTDTWYTATVKNGVCPAVSSDTAIVTIIPTSQAGTLSGPLKVCNYYNTDTIYYSGGVGAVTNWIASNDGGLTYTSSGTTQNNLPFSGLTSPTIFGVIVQNMNCPVDTGFYHIGINPRPALVANGDTVCFGNPIAFTNMSTISSGFIASYNWDFADGNFSSLHSPSYTYADTGNYVSVLSAISNLGCVDTILVPSRVNSIPSSKITLSSPTANICKGDTITLSGANLPGFSYIWSDGDTAWSTNVDTSGVFVLTVADSITGCWSKDSAQTFLFYPPVINASNDTTIPTAGTATLGVSVTPAAGNYTYNWLPAPDQGGTTSIPVVTPSVTTEYVVTVTNEYGCSAKDSVKVTLDLKLVELFIPNLITPNGDGFNDKFEIKKLELFKQNSLAIVNRSGQLIYSMENYDNSWEGTYQGNVVQDGSYYYILKISSGSIAKEFKGPINVLRSK